MKEIAVEDQFQIKEFVDHLWLESGLSKNTQSAYQTDLRLCATWLIINICLALSEKICWHLWGIKLVRA